MKIDLDRESKKRSSHFEMYIPQKYITPGRLRWETERELRLLGMRGGDRGESNDH